MADNMQGPSLEFGGQKFDLFKLVGMAPKEVETKVEKEEVEEAEDAGELYILTRDFFSVDLDPFTKKYPGTSAVAAFACGFFALMYVFSFSPSNILVGAFLGVLSIGLGKSLFKMEKLIWKVWAGLKNITQVPEPSDAEIAKEKEVKLKGKKV